MINLSFFGANSRIRDYRKFPLRDGTPVNDMRLTQTITVIKNGISSIEINTFCIFLHSLSVDHKRLFLLSIH